MFFLQGKPIHAAYQLPSGLWVSKLGRMEEIEHPLLALSNDIFGEPMLYLARKIEQVWIP